MLSTLTRTTVGCFMVKTDFVLHKSDVDLLLDMWECVPKIPPEMVQVDENGVRDNDSVIVDRSFRESVNAWVEPSDVKHITEEMARHFGFEGVCKESAMFYYDKGCFFKKHLDRHEVYAPNRTFTVITMLDKSDDLKGGYLVIHHHDDVEEPIDLDIGESILHSSDVPHEVTMVEDGWRKVFVAWFYPLDIT